MRSHLQNECGLVISFLAFLQKTPNTFTHPILLFFRSFSSSPFRCHGTIISSYYCMVVQSKWFALNMLKRSQLYKWHSVCHMCIMHHNLENYNNVCIAKKKKITNERMNIVLCHQNGQLFGFWRAFILWHAFSCPNSCSMTSVTCITDTLC